ncbi:hypothetical protein Enr10x_52590 [Gimesia panareensis]|uniref:PD-(D/E)XK nuclease superfamily protein n=1 Tax=Gimesia panareensis TaxID=2527978 RepID=A0A517QE34_9PLAN|nr:hypothetical protein [Gimesia panareensis]QDT29902.1 hypothetical protein Enr10x_52590 [Gimesia panareensis]
MLTELGGKGGCLCEPAKSGSLRCPLIVRPTSEDVITGHLFGTLRAINPRWWLPDFLNQALGVERFRRQVFRNLRIELWQKQPAFPRWLIPWDEGQTEVDVVITWENPPTTVFIEMKYGSPLSGSTVHNNGHAGYPSDQLIRNARVGLYQCGWYVEDKLFEFPSRDFNLILLSPKMGNPLVEQYRDLDKFQEAIPHSDKLASLPSDSFIGEMSYSGTIDIARTNHRFMNKTEQRLTDQLKSYIDLKMSQIRYNT